MKKFYFVLAFILCLSGCTSKYVAPTSGGLAYIKTGSTGTNYELLSGFEGYTVMVGRFDESGCINGADEVNEESLDANGYFAVSSSEQILLSVQRFTGNKMCRFSRILTTLESDSRYFIDYSLRGKGCYLTFYKINSEPDGKLEKVDYEKIENSYGFCRDQTN